MNALSALREPHERLLCNGGGQFETRAVRRGYVGLFLLVHRRVSIDCHSLAGEPSGAAAAGAVACEGHADDQVLLPS